MGHEIDPKTRILWSEHLWSWERFFFFGLPLTTLSYNRGLEEFLSFGF